MGSATLCPIKNLPFPALSISGSLNFVFHIIWKVAEEVYARKFLQFVDGNDIFLEVILTAVNILVECPECESLISLTVFIQYSQEPQAATMSMVAASSI